MFSGPKKKPIIIISTWAVESYGTRNSTKDAVGSKQYGAKVKMLSYSRDLIVMMVV